MLALNGKVVAITGIGSPDNPKGNGRAIAELFAKQGAFVEGIDYQKIEGTRSRDAIRKTGGKCQLTVGDVTSETDVNAWISAVVNYHGRLDILINNVGQSARMTPAAVDTACWREQLELNLNSVMMTCRAALPHMIDQGHGVVVNISSIAGIRYLGKPQIGYSAAKAALQQYTKTSAIIHAKNNIRMNCVLPGLMHTAMLNRMADEYADGDFEGYIDKRNKQVPLGCMGTAEDVANATLFLASDEARYITGTELIVDGGVTATIPD
ncbi:MAG: 3-oxoacyl-ACP reductase [Gammaproteobacteria bacterium]|nr:3-oxoacyl-ACP reductase [Gammaproteobacteria bacterium]